VLFSSIVALLVQIFYAIRIWKFSQRNILLVASLSVFIMGQFVSSIVWVGKAINMTMLAELKELDPLSITMDGLAVAADVLITIVICVLLRGARTSLQRSNTMINLLIAFSVQTGMLTSLCAIAALVSIVASPNTLIYGCFYYLLGRLYCNSLLATLNVRDAIRERGNNNTSISLRPFDGSNSSSTANRREIDIKAEIVDAGSHRYAHSHDGKGTSSFVPSLSHIDNPQAV